MKINKSTNYKLYQRLEGKGYVPVNRKCSGKPTFCFEIDGVKYDRMKGVREATGLSGDVIYGRCGSKSERWAGWKKIPIKDD